MCLCPARNPYTFTGVGPDVGKNVAACKAEIDAEANAPKGCIAPAHVDPKLNTFCICDENPPRELQQGDASCQAPAGGSCISPAVINATNSNFCTCPAITPYTIKKNDASCDLTYRGGGGTTGGGTTGGGGPSSAGNAGDCTYGGYSVALKYSQGYQCNVVLSFKSPWYWLVQPQSTTLLPPSSNPSQLCRAQCENAIPWWISGLASFCHGGRQVFTGCSGYQA